MRRAAWALAPLLLCLSSAWGLQDAKEPPKKEPPKKDTTKREPPKLSPAAEEYRTLQGEVRKAQSEILPKYRAAKTDEEREQALEEYYKAAEPFAPRFLEFAKKNDKDPTAFQALVFVVSNGGEGESVTAAIDALLKDHKAQSGTAARMVARGRGKAPEQFLRAVVEKSTDGITQAAACEGLGQILKGRADKAREKNPTEADKLAADAEQQFALVTTKLAEAKRLLDGAEASLFEMRNLSVGKTVPEVEADDTDGKKFKLSDYRGKVVLIDFWGHW